jgi:hypothetical protein
MMRTLLVWITTMTMNGWRMSRRGDCSCTCILLGQHNIVKHKFFQRMFLACLLAWALSAIPQKSRMESECGYLPCLMFARVARPIHDPNWETGRVTLNRSDPCWILGLLKIDKLLFVGCSFLASFIDDWSFTPYTSPVEPEVTWDHSKVKEYK